MLTTQGGIVGAALDEAERPQCPRCERCGCGLIGGPAELMLCSTCLPAEVLQLRAEVSVLEELLGSVSPPLLFIHETNRHKIRRREGGVS